MMTTLRSSLILVMAPMMLMSANAAAGNRIHKAITPARCNHNLSSFSSTRRANPTCTAAFISKRKCILIPRGGDGGPGGQKESDATNHDISSQDEDLIISDRSESSGDNNIMEEGGAWEEIIRQTREYYHSVQSPKLSSPLNLVTSPSISAPASPADTATAATNTSTTAASDNNGEDGRVFGHSHTTCDDNVKVNGVGDDEDDEDVENLISTTTMGRVEGSDSEDESSIHNDNNIDPKGDQTNDRQIAWEEVQDTSDVASTTAEDDEMFGMGDEISSQETGTDEIMNSQNETGEITENGGDDHDVNKGIHVNDGDVKPSLDELEDGKIHHAVEEGATATEEIAAETKVEEGDIVQNLNTQITNLVDDDELNSFPTTEQSKGDSLDEKYEDDLEPGAIEAASAGIKSFKGATSALIRRFQRRVTNFSTSCRRKEMTPIVVASLGVALSLLLNLVRVNTNASDGTAQRLEFRSNDDDVLPSSGEEQLVVVESD